MSMQTMIRSHPLGDAAPDGGQGRRPSVVPTRRRLDRRFSSLGFTISTPQPWVEILLATDPSLLDPARSAARTPANFYASRVHGGLTPTTSGRARYVVPANVVTALAASASSVWFLAVAYADSSGLGGLTSAEAGASGAVVIDASLRPGRAAPATVRGASLARGLGLDADDRLEGEDGGDVRQVLNPAGAVPLAVGQELGVDDRLQGEDGADLPADVQVASPVTAPAAAAPVVTVPQPRAELPLPEPVATPPADTAVTSGPQQLEYDDGWGSIDQASVPALSAIPALSDEYPDIDWGGADLDRDAYGELPAYQSLEDVPAVAPQAPHPVVLPTVGLPAETQRRVIELAVSDGGNAYSMVNADGPFRGRHGPGHKAYQRFHTGLSFGIAGFNQDSGTLGQLLRLMQEREPETFAAVFGPDAATLVTVTTAPGPSGEHVEGGRSSRVQPVAGTDLWEEPWLSRFRAAGAVPDFRAAQNQLTAELFLAPMLTVAAGFGLTTERALSMVLDRAIVLGEQGAKRWLADTVGPVKTPALRRTALSSLGFASIEAFQASVPGLLTDGEFGPLTHATLTAALRTLGTAAPLPLPGTRDLVEEMARRGQAEEGGARLVRIATGTEFGDVPIGG